VLLAPVQAAELGLAQQLLLRLLPSMCPSFHWR